MLSYNVINVLARKLEVFTIKSPVELLKIVENSLIYCLVLLFPKQTQSDTDYVQ